MPKNFVLELVFCYQPKLLNMVFKTFARLARAGGLAFAFFFLLHGAAQATVVTNLNQAGLLAALTNNSPVTFITNGTIVLTNTLVITNNTTIDGEQNSVTLSGSNAVRIFFVTNNAILTLLNLTVANGFSSNGAGIFNAGGMVVLSNCFLSANLALGNVAKDGRNGSSASDGTAGGAGFTGMGGGIYNQGGVVALQRTTVFGNAASGSNGGIGGDGGDGSQFGGNGGRGGSGAEGFGGGIYNLGTVSVTNCIFQFNFAAGGDGGAGGVGGIGSFPGVAGDGGRGAAAFGGGIYNLGTLTVNNSTFLTNNAAGGDSAHAGPGFSDNGDNGGASYGGAIYNSSALWITNSSFTENLSRGGRGGDVYTASYLEAGNGGNAYGGAIYSSNSMTLVNCTVATNNATGGTNGVSAYPGNSGSTGQSLGGGIHRASGTVTLRNTILAKGTSGANGSGAITDGGYNLSSDASCNFTSAFGSSNNVNVRLAALANNGGVAPTLALLTGSPAIDSGDPANCGGIDQRGIARPQGFRCDIGAYEFVYSYTISGRITDGTNGLSGITVNVGTNTTVSQTNGSFSFAALATGNYVVAPALVGGGFSPASQVVFVGTNAAFPFVGTNATNVNFTANRVSLSASSVQSSNGVVQIQGLGVPGKIYQFQASTNLTNWITFSTNTAAVNGIFQFLDTNATRMTKRFFRAIATSQTAPSGPPPLP